MSSPEDINTAEIKSNLIKDVTYLSEKIGPRSYQNIKNLNTAADYIEERFRFHGCDVKRQAFTYEDNTYYNIICRGCKPLRTKGLQTPEGKGVHDSPILVIGAHYDTVTGTPGADDNASGVAGLIELARLMSKDEMGVTVHFVAFSMEEPPAFRTRHMGSYAYAKSLKDSGANVMGMISLEMIGYYREWEGSQLYPLPFFRWLYPKKGNFIAFVGDLKSRALTKRFKKAFCAVSDFPHESLNTIRLVPGVDFSDHSSFWKFGYPAFMITDTAFYRNPDYHGMGDTASTLDYDKMTELIIAVYKAVKTLN